MSQYTDIDEFLPCPTPDSWLALAQEQLDILLIDHAHCEKKAASNALSLMYRYADKHALLHHLSRLAREELRHFEQVLSIMTKRNIQYGHLTSSRYAAGLRQSIRHQEPERLIDHLIISAFIEARSCERFRSLVPLLDESLSQFYQSLCQSEARHFRGFLAMAEQVAEQSIDDRIAFFAGVEQQLIVDPDTQFRFHSGVPA